MSIRVWIKSRFADKALAPVRHDLIQLIPEGASVLEIGCGTGDLLFRSAARIGYGLGVDQDREMISYASSRARNDGFDNLHFHCGDARKLGKREFDIATATLCLHEMGEAVACEVLSLMLDCARTVLVADYSRAKTHLTRLGIELDEMISGHYGKFRKYRRSGGIPSYAGKINATVQSTLPTSMDGISLWILEGKGKAG